MTRKLKLADLGFYVKVTETQEKLGMLVGTWEAFCTCPLCISLTYSQDPSTSVGLSSA